MGLTNQIVFERVSAHLLQQRKKSERLSYRRVEGEDDVYKCVYRGKDGLTCAIGCLIPDKLYREEMEDKSITGLIKDFPPIADLFKGVSKGLLQSLQRVHDSYSPPEWKWKLDSTREAYHIQRVN